MLDLRGEKAEAAIPKIRQAAADYPYRDSSRAGDSRMWPGPNSNTFVSFILCPALKLPMAGRLGMRDAPL